MYIGPQLNLLFLSQDWQIKQVLYCVMKKLLGEGSVGRPGDISYYTQHWRLLRMKGQNTLSRILEVYIQSARKKAISHSKVSVQFTEILYLKFYFITCTYLLIYFVKLKSIRCAGTFSSRGARFAPKFEHPHGARLLVIALRVR